MLKGYICGISIHCWFPTYPSLDVWYIFLHSTDIHSDIEKVEHCCGRSWRTSWRRQIVTHNAGKQSLVSQCVLYIVDWRQKLQMTLYNCLYWLSWIPRNQWTPQDSFTFFQVIFTHNGELFWENCLWLFEVSIMPQQRAQYCKSVYTGPLSLYPFIWTLFLH